MVYSRTAPTAAHPPTSWRPHKKRTAASMPATNNMGARAHAITRSGPLPAMIP